MIYRKSIDRFSLSPTRRQKSADTERIRLLVKSECKVKEKLREKRIELQNLPGAQQKLIQLRPVPISLEGVKRERRIVENSKTIPIWHQLVPETGKTVPIPSGTTCGDECPRLFAESLLDCQAITKIDSIPQSGTNPTDTQFNLHFANKQINRHTSSTPSWSTRKNTHSHGNNVTVLTKQFTKRKERIPLSVASR